MNDLQLSYSKIDQFIDTIWSEKGLSKLTLDAYQQDLKLFSQWLNKQNLVLTEATQTSILEYLAFLITFFLVTDFLATVFFAGALFATAFFATAFFTGAFFTGAFFAGDFLTAGFFDTAFFAGAFFAAALGRPRPVFITGVFFIADFLVVTLFLDLTDFLLIAILYPDK